MKTIGLVGGVTYLSTLDYYRLLNEMVNERMGGVTSAKILMYSVNFAEIKTLTEKLDWDGIAAIINPAAKKLEQAGADCLLICANTMHYIAEKVQATINIPLIHIAEETAKKVTQKNIKKVALLGTKYTMQMNFYKNKLAMQGVETIIPNEAEIEIINSAIYNEMGKGIFTAATKAAFLTIIERLKEQGAEAAVLGCTEIPILIKQEDTSLLIFDTTLIHATTAVDFSLQ
jgi:aspartate racemase